MFGIIYRQKRVDRQAKPCLFVIQENTPPDMVELLTPWHTNPTGVPYPICQEANGVLNFIDLDIWMWLKKIFTPKTASRLKKVLWSIFKTPGQWCKLLDRAQPATTLGDTLRTSVQGVFPSTSTPGEGEAKDLAMWLAKSGGVDVTDRCIVRALGCTCIALCVHCVVHALHCACIALCVHCVVHVCCVVHVDRMVCVMLCACVSPVGEMLRKNKCPRKFGALENETYSGPEKDWKFLNILITSLAQNMLGIVYIF